MLVYILTIGGHCIISVYQMLPGVVTKWKRKDFEVLNLVKIYCHIFQLCLCPFLFLNKVKNSFLLVWFCLINAELPKIMIYFVIKLWKNRIIKLILNSSIKQTCVIGVILLVPSCHKRLYSESNSTTY